MAFPALFLGCRVWAACGGGFGSKGAAAVGWSIVLGACPAIRAERRVAVKDRFVGPLTTDKTVVACVEARGPCLGGKVATVRGKLRGLSDLTVCDGILAVVIRKRTS